MRERDEDRLLDPPTARRFDEKEWKWRLSRVKDSHRAGRLWPPLASPAAPHRRSSWCRGLRGPGG